MKSREQIEKIYLELQDQINVLEEELEEDELNCGNLDAESLEHIQRELSEVRGKASLLREILDG